MRLLPSFAWGDSSVALTIAHLRCHKAFNAVKYWTHVRLTERPCSMPLMYFHSHISQDWEKRMRKQSNYILFFDIALFSKKASRFQFIQKHANRLAPSRYLTLFPIWTFRRLFWIFKIQYYERAVCMEWFSRPPRSMLLMRPISSISTGKNAAKLWLLWNSLVSHSLLRLSSTTCTWYITDTKTLKSVFVSP